jgi:uncharacterized protein (TIGR02597 family)
MKNMGTQWASLLLRAVVFTGISIFSIFSNSAATATLVWDANSEADLDGYYVYFGPVNTTPQKIDVHNVTSLTFTNLDAGVTYAFYATAYNKAALESNPSQQVTFKYDCCGVTLEDAGTAGMKVHFASTSGKTYAVEAKDNFPGGSWQPLANSLPGNGNSMEVLDANGDTVANRVYRVRTIGTDVSTESTGFQRLPLPGNSDTVLSIPFIRPPAALSSIASVSGSTVQVSGSPGWVANKWAYSSGTQANTYFLLIRSGSREGDYFTIIGNGANSLTLDLQAGNLTGVSVGDTVAIVPYWTLATIFPGGEGIHASPTAGNRSTEIFVPNISGQGINLTMSHTYYFWNGAWREVGMGAVVKNDEVFLPDMYIWVRHNIATSTELVALGSVIPTKWRLPVTRLASSKQDNILALPRPGGISLKASGLIESGAFKTSPTAGSRTDELYVYDNSAIAKNKTVAATYYYWNGGWRKVGFGTTDFGNDLVFAPGTGVILRASAAATSPDIWINQPAY